MRSPWQFVAGLVSRRSASEIATDDRGSDETTGASPTSGSSDIGNVSADNVAEADELRNLTEHVRTDSDGRSNTPKSDILNARSSAATPKVSIATPAAVREARARRTSPPSPTLPKEAEVVSDNRHSEAGVIDQEIQHLRAQLAQKLRIQNSQLKDLLARYD
jgi:hypothetical protein